MFFRLLDKLRSKPSHVRRLIALVFSISFTGIVGIVWLFSYATYISETTKGGILTKLYEPINKIGNIIGTGVSNLEARKNTLFGESSEAIKGAKEYGATHPGLNATSGVNRSDSEANSVNTTEAENMYSNNKDSSTSSQELIQ